MERNLLLVDDEENILASLVRLLRREGYNILRANSGQAGLDLLREQEVGVIISDQRMPGMTGVEFLGKVKELYPETVRIVLSGYTDLKCITDSINEGAIFRFLTKPWDDELLRKNVRDAFEHYELKHENLRLTQELRTANTKLEHQVEQKSQDAAFNMTALQVTQDVLEYMPAAIIGIARDGILTVANRQAQGCLPGTSLLGQKVEAVLPTEIVALYQSAIVGHEVPAKQVISLSSLLKVSVQCVSLGKTDNPRGWVIVMCPMDGD